MNKILIPAAVAALVPIISGPSAAYQSTDGGTAGLDYQDSSGGPYAGSYHADGAILAGVGPTGGTCAFSYQLEGEHVLVVLSARPDGDAVDAAAILMRSPVPFAPGDFAVEAIGQSVLFAFIDDTTTFHIPENPPAVNWRAWFEGLVAAKKFVSGIGSITLTSVEGANVRGHFQGTTVEYTDNTLVAVTNGAFEIVGNATAVEAASWGRIKANHRD